MNVLDRPLASECIGECITGECIGECITGECIRQASSECIGRF